MIEALAAPFLLYLVFVLGLFIGYGCKHFRRPRIHVRFYFGRWRIRTIVQLKVNDSLPITVQAADEFGNPVVGGFDSPPSWSSSDESVAVVAVADDGLSASVTSPAGKLASASIQVSGLVSGQAVLGSLQIDMVAGDVASLVLSPGAPVAVPLPVAPPVAPV